LRGWKFKTFLTSGNYDFEWDCQCNCCDHNECFHAAHTFYYNCDLCESEEEEYSTYDPYENCANKDEEEWERGEKQEKSEEPPEPTDRLQRVAYRIQKVTGTRYPAYVVDNPEINGYADGNCIAVTSGAVNSLDDDELAYLVGHEITHNIYRHGEHRARRSDSTVDRTLNVAFRSGGLIRGLIVGALSLIVGSLIDSKMARIEEGDSDEESKNIMRKAGYNPNKGVDVFRKIDPSGKSGGGLFESHPKIYKRIENLQKK
jgi:Zn-dependent protease with chaperone function